MKRFFVLPLILLILGSNCYGSNEPVDKMFKVMEMDKQLNAGFEAMLPLIDQMALKFNLDENAKEELKDIYRTWFDKDIDRTSMLNKMKELYSNRFSEKEIDEITKFYQTPIGQKFLKQSPELIRQGTQLGMAEAQSKQTLLLNRLTPFFEKYNIK